MKKLFALLLVLCMALSIVACGSKGGNTADSGETETGKTETSEKETSKDETSEDETSEDETSETETTEGDVQAKSEGVMTYAEYAAAELDTQVVVETFVQAKEGWWDNKATIYTQDADGAYFLYDMPCTQEEYDQLTIGTKIKVTGYKSEYSSMVEIIDATFEIEEGTYVAEAFDATSILGTDELVSHLGQLVTFKGLTVEASDDNNAAFLYNWDGSGAEGDSVYFTVSLNGQTYSFNVRNYLCGPDTAVYQAATALNVGDVIDVTCYLYYYAGEPQPRAIDITVQ